MRVVLGLDVGTTSLSALAYDCDSQIVLAQVTLANDSSRYGELPGGLLRAELDLDDMRRQLVNLLTTTARELPPEAHVDGIGVTGQQHGMALLDANLQPLAPAITWQDLRTLLPIPERNQTWLEAFIDQAGGIPAFERTGCLPAAGFLGPSVYWWLNEHPGCSRAAYACLIPDAAVTLLTGLPPMTDATDAGSSGLFDLVSGDWAWELVDRLGLPRELLPPVVPAGSPRGPLCPEIAEAAGLPRVPVCVAAGDNQASFVGSVREPERSALLNIGTGGQISLLTDAFSRIPGIETRAFFGGRYLLVGAGLYGGRAYAYLQGLFQQVGAAFFGQQEPRELYDDMNHLAAQVPQGCDGLRCVPLFTGTREHPELRASYTGMGPTNLTPGHMARALLEGIIEGFWQMYGAIASVAGERQALVGAGNALTRNPVLAEIAAIRFAMDLYLTPQVEAAALGAALLAADGLGLLPLSQGMASLHYDRVVRPPLQ